MDTMQTWRFASCSRTRFRSHRRGLHQAAVTVGTLAIALLLPSSAARADPPQAAVGECVTLSEFPGFVECLTGPAFLAHPSCLHWDFDLDGHIDLLDFAWIQQHLCGLCELDCPPGATPEGEPVCYDDYADTFNAGCGAVPVPLFSPIACGQIVCGTFGAFLETGYQTRDTDWYELLLTETTELTFTVAAEYEAMFMIIAAPSGDCSDFEILEFATADPCAAAQIVRELPAGLYWLWVASSAFEDVPCGSEYTATVDCGV